MTGDAVIEAVVQVGAEETPYLRCGSGPRAVVVLAMNREERLAMLRRYAPVYRVIAPDMAGCPATAGHGAGGGFRTAVPATGSSTSAPAAPTPKDWLLGVVEGLGLDRPLVALAPDLAQLAAQLAAGCGDELDVLIPVAPEAA